MNANNTSSFCFRVVAGTTRLSNHAMGHAIDVNPIQNPWMRNAWFDPEIGSEYENRHEVREGMVVYGDDFERAFFQYGFDWAGDWITPIDIQHFEKNPGKTRREMVAQTMATMTLEEKVAQLFIVDFTDEGSNRAPFTSNEWNTLPGGIIFPQGQDDILDLCQEIEKEILAKDVSQGTIYRPFYATNQLPTTLATDAEDFRTDMKDMAVLLSDSGFTLNLMPDKKVEKDDLSQAAALTKVGMQALQENKVYCAVPLLLEGTTGDQTLTQLKAADFPVIQGAIDRNAAMIMVPHVALPQVTGNNASIATSSAFMEVIRKDLGFRKVILVDALNESYEKEFGISSKAALDCILAGADMVVIPADKEMYIDAVLASVRSGAITQERIDESVYRILDLKV